MSALEALERAGRPWRLMCTSESQSGIHAAVAAGLGVAPTPVRCCPRGSSSFATIGCRRSTRSNS
ncbi:hypothetical protein ACFSTI_02860 [Rhizorhabdus histidinilytica]